MYCVLLTDYRITNLNETYHRESKEIDFSWSPLNVTDCPSVFYIINATEECGNCPRNVSINVATCTGAKEGKTCTLSVHAVFCYDQTKDNITTVLIVGSGSEGKIYIL